MIFSTIVKKDIALMHLSFCQIHIQKEIIFYLIVKESIMKKVFADNESLKEVAGGTGIAYREAEKLKQAPEVILDTEESMRTELLDEVDLPEITPEIDISFKSEENVKVNAYNTYLEKNSILEINAQENVFSLNVVFQHAITPLDDGSFSFTSSVSMSAYNAVSSEYVSATYEISMQFAIADEPMTLPAFHAGLTDYIENNGSQVAQDMYEEGGVNLLASLIPGYTDMQSTYANIESVIVTTPFEEYDLTSLSELPAEQRAFLTFVTETALLGLVANPETLNYMLDNKESAIEELKSLITETFMKNSIEEVINFVEAHPEDAQLIVGEDINLQEFKAFESADIVNKAIDTTTYVIESKGSASLIELDSTKMAETRAVA